VASELAGTGPQLGGGFLCKLQILLNGKNDFCDRGREIPAGLRCSGLDDDWISLRRAGDVERPLDGKILSPVVELMHFGSVGELSAGLVHGNRAVLPAVPQPYDDLHELSRDRIAHVVRRMTPMSEVGGGLAKCAGDDVP